MRHFFIMHGYPTYFYLSSVRAASIYKGELRASLPFVWPSSLAAPSRVYGYQHYTYVPYPVEGWRVRGHGLTISVLHFERLAQGGGDKKGYDLFLSWRWLHEQFTKGFSLDYLVFCQDFRVIDDRGEAIGFVDRVQARKIQPLLVVNQGEETIEIPVHEQFIRGVDVARRCIRVAWPPRKGREK